jgi:hypothetical protein
MTKSITASALCFSAICFSANAFAISDADLSTQCLEVGKAKILVQAEAFGCAIDISKVEVQEIDNRWYNPSKYVWYQVLGQCNEYDRIIKLVQYYSGRCF